MQNWHIWPLYIFDILAASLFRWIKLYWSSKKCLLVFPFSISIYDAILTGYYLQINMKIRENWHAWALFKAIFFHTFSVTQRKLCSLCYCYFHLLMWSHNILYNYHWRYKLIKILFISTITLLKYIISCPYIWSMTLIFVIFVKLRMIICCIMWRLLQSFCLNT